MTLNQIIQLFKTIGDNFYFIKHTEFGGVPEFIDSTTDAVLYPAFYQTLEDTTTLTNTLERTFTLIVCDLVKPDKSNLNEVLSDTEQTLNSIIKVLRQESDYYTLINNPQLLPFKDRYGDAVAGWEVEVVIETLYNDGFCDIPSDIFGLGGITGTNGIPVAQFGCDDLAECETIQSIQDDITQLFNDIGSLPTLTFNNGLMIDQTAFVSNTIILGGLLNQNTFLDGAFDFEIGGNITLNSFYVNSDYSEFSSYNGSVGIYSPQISIVSGVGILPLDPTLLLLANFNTGGNVYIKADSTISLTGTIDATNGNIQLANGNFLYLDGSIGDLGIGRNTIAVVPGLDIYNGSSLIKLLDTGEFGIYTSGITANKIAYLDSSKNLKSATFGINDVELIANKGIANGYASLDANGKIPSSQVPAIAITDTYVVSSTASMLGLTAAETGDIAVRTDLNKSFILKGITYSVLSDWQELLTPTDTVTSVNGMIGAVPLTGTTNRITVSAANLFDISSNYIGQSSITTVGTISSGAWNGTSISTTYTDAKIKGTATVSNGILFQNGTTDTVTTNANLNYSGGNFTANSFISTSVDWRGTPATMDVYLATGTTGASTIWSSINGGGGSNIRLYQSSTTTFANKIHFRVGSTIFADFNNTNSYLNTPLSISHTATATAYADIASSTTTNASIRIRSGVAPTTPNAGDIWNVTDKLYYAITTGGATKEITLNDAALTSTCVPFVTTNGRLTNTSNFVWDNGTVGLKLTQVGTNANPLLTIQKAYNGDGVTVPVAVFNRGAGSNPTATGTGLHISFGLSDQVSVFSSRADVAQLAVMYDTSVSGAGSTNVAYVFKQMTNGSLGETWRISSNKSFTNTSGTGTAMVDIKGSTSSQASLRIRSGSAPSSPNDGDIWYDGTNLKMYIGGLTKTFTLT